MQPSRERLKDEGPLDRNKNVTV